jgi:hypothetical protein
MQLVEPLTPPEMPLVGQRIEREMLPGMPVVPLVTLRKA